MVVHDTAQTEIGDHDVRILIFRPEEQVLRLKIWTEVSILCDGFRRGSRSLLTSVHNPAAVNIFDSGENGPHKAGCVSKVLNIRWARERAKCDTRFVVVALGTYPIEELASGAKIEAKIEVVGSLQPGVIVGV